MALMAILAVAQVATDNSFAFFSASMIFLVVYSFAGNAVVPLFVIGLNIMDDLTVIPSTPMPRLVAVLLALLAVSTIRAVATKRPILVDLPLGALSALLVSYYFLAPPDSNAGVAAAFGMIILPITVFVVRWYLSTFLTDPRPLILAFIIGSSIAIGRGVWQAYTSVGADYDEYISNRIFESSIGSSNKAAAMAVVVGIMIFSQAWYARLNHRIFWLLLSAPFLAAPVVFASRGPLVSLLVTAAFAIVFGKFAIAKKVAAVSIALVGTLLLLSSSLAQEIPVISRLFSGGGAEEFSSGRTIIWSYVASRFTDQPILGHGPGAIAGELLAQGMTGYPHQFFLGLLASLGLCGSIFYIWALFRQLSGGWGRLTPVLVYLILVSMLEPVISTPGGAPLAGVLLALYGISRGFRNEYRDGDCVS